MLYTGKGDAGMTSLYGCDQRISKSSAIAEALGTLDELNSYLGSAFSVEPILFQSAWWRPHNKSEDVEGLYFVGAGTHPGAGLPGVMSSGTIASRMIAEF